MYVTHDLDKFHVSMQMYTNYINNECNNNNIIPQLRYHPKIATDINLYDIVVIGRRHDTLYGVFGAKRLGAVRVSRHLTTRRAWSLFADIARCHPFNIRLMVAAMLCAIHQRSEVPSFCATFAFYSVNLYDLGLECMWFISVAGLFYLTLRWKVQILCLLNGILKGVEYIMDRMCLCWL